MTRKDSPRALITIVAASMFYFYAVFQMSVTNTIAPELMKTFNITPYQLGTLSSLFFYGDICFVIFAGLLLDSLSIKKIILTAGLLCSIASAVFAISTSIYLAGIARFIIGIADALSFLGCMKLASKLFSSHRLATTTGMIITIGMMGGIMAQTPFAILLQTITWREGLLLSSLISFFFLLINCYTLEKDVFVANQKNASPLYQLKNCILKIQNWLCGLYACLFNLPIALISSLWGVIYLKQTQGFSTAEASLVTMMIFIGTMIGAPFMGWLSDFISSRKIPMLLGAIASICISIIIIQQSNANHAFMLLLFLLLGIFTSAQIIIFPILSENNPDYPSTATSCSSILIMGGGAVFQPLFGWLVQAHSTTANATMITSYTSADLKRAFLIIPIAFIVGFISACFIKKSSSLAHQS